MTFGVLEIVSLPRKKRKNREEKSHFFSLCVALFGCWEMNFVKGKWKERTRKVIFELLIFLKNVFNKLFIYLVYIGLNERVTN